MKWLKYKLFLILVSAMFGGGPVFFASSAPGADITTDPLVLQQTDRANWEPGGVYFPGNFQDRGSIIARGGNVTTSLNASINVGGWSLQSATISGQYTYTNDLTFNHPHTVHSPFNFSNSASDSVNTSGNGRQVTVNMSWNGTMVHPANGYDGAQGGGYPAPVGAIDLFTFNITGNASGAFLVSSQDRQQAENSNERFNPLTDLTVPTNTDTSPRVGGRLPSGSGIAPNNQTGQSGNDLAIQQSINPTDYNATAQARFGDVKDELIKLIKKGGITKEEHYIRNVFNKQVSYEDANANNDKWKVMSTEKTALHQWGVEGKGNVKFVSQDGHHEVIFDSSGNLVTDPQNLGTYNYFAPSGVSGIFHIIHDVDTYLKWGNSPEDTTTMPERQEIWNKAITQRADKAVTLSPHTEMGKACDKAVRRSIEVPIVNSVYSSVVCGVGADTIGKVKQGAEGTIKWIGTTVSNVGNVLDKGFRNINPRYFQTGFSGLY